MKITPKFYKREAKGLVEGNVVFRTVSADPNLCRMFVREESDSGYPARVCVEMSRLEVKLMMHDMLREFSFLQEPEAK